MVFVNSIGDRGRKSIYALQHSYTDAEKRRTPGPHVKGVDFVSIAQREEHDACGIGFVADLGGAPSHKIIDLGLAAVGAMRHRGAVAADGRTGDGAGLLCETPRAFFARELHVGGLRVPAGRIAALSLFLPRSADSAGGVRALVEAAVRRAELTPLRWRRPPIDERVLGEHARATRPLFEQLLIDCGPGNVRERMRTVRALIERALRDARTEASLVSASENSVVYKALLSSHELGRYFTDLRDPLFASRYALFHQRFSTNSAPSWNLVQPFAHIAHNGEINTITGNRAWLDARGVKRLPGASDSSDLDVAVGAMLGAGYRIDHAVDLLLAPSIPADDTRLRAYYDAHLPTVEPWDGPAALVFAEGDVIGAALDRAGLRPLRWSRTAGNIVLAASEAGVVDFGSDPVVARGRLGPGGRLIVRMATGGFLETDAFRAERRESADYRPLVQSWQFAAKSELVPPSAASAATEDDAIRLRDQLRFGWKKEEVKDVVAVLADGREPVSSMGDDAALALFERGIFVAGYLRQRFAQVTNPPIDPLREAFVFDMRAFVGAGENNGDVPGARTIVMLENGIIAEADFDALIGDERIAVHRPSLDLGPATLAGRIEAVAAEAVAAVARGASLIVLDDRPAAPSVPVVLIAGAIHHELTKAGLRMAASIAAADGSIRDAHGAAAVLAMGANIVSPWLAERTAGAADGTGQAYIYALRAGLLKILAKLGICTLRSYVGAQTFESLGLGVDVVARCFPGVRAHVPAVSFAHIEEDVRAWFADAEAAAPLRDRGSYRFRRDGVRRSFDPAVIKGLRATAIRGDYAAFEELSDAMESRAPLALRDLIEPHTQADAVTPDLVETEDAIARTFVTAAMSLGALAPEVHEVIARAANLLGARSNSGEGGEHARRFSRAPDSGRSRIKQIASARFGVGIRYLASADEIEIKIAQGSKPGEGGQIPGNKVSLEIAELRGAVAGRPLISPPPHHDIYSIEDLAELIYDLRRAAPHARIAVKLVSQSGIGYVACGVAKAGADAIHISGHDGGTGASPLASIKHAGLPWELGLVETHHALLATGLRARVTLRTDGGLKSGRDVIIAAMLGAEEFGFGSALLVALGCIYARQCHKNTCPVGIATQDPQLRAKFAGTADEAQAYLRFIARDVRRRLAKLGVRSLAEIHGRSDFLRRRSELHDDYAHIDLSEILRLPEEDAVEHGAVVDSGHLDDAVGTMPVLPIAPSDRAVGARLAAIRAGRDGQAPPEETIRYRGTAGQSFGAFLTAGLSLVLDGDANDYVGKSMDGGTIVILGHGNNHEPVAGNACFYGARGGRAYLAGGAGERFAVRNSGAEIVLEGAGDHAAEYMTAGTIVILGTSGRNIASGMSGGTVFLLETPDTVRARLGPTDCSVDVPQLGDPSVRRMHELLEAHAAATGSAVAREVLAAWPASLAGFARIGDA